MVEYTECLKSWISVPKGKCRPLLAGVFRSAEEVDKACNITSEDLQIAVNGAKDSEEAATVVSEAL